MTIVTIDAVTSIHPMYIDTVDPFSALTLLVGQQEGHPARKKTEWWVADVVICLERGADLHMAQLIPLLLTVSCHPGSPGKRAVKRHVYRNKLIYLSIYLQQTSVTISTHKHTC